MANSPALMVLETPRDRSPKQDLGGNNTHRNEVATKDSPDESKAATPTPIPLPKATSTVPQSSTVVVRKKLPWLESRPANRSPLAESAVQNIPAESPALATKEKSDTKSYIPTPNNDLSLRAIGSTPSLRQKASVADSVAYSQSSQLPSGLRYSLVARSQPKIVEAAPAKSVYASSEYSATEASDSGHGFSQSWVAPSPDDSQGETAFSTTNGRGATRPKPDPNSYRQTDGDGPLDRGHIHCRSCDVDIESAPPAMTHQDKHHRHPLSKPRRESTLHILPLHLMSRSSSSNQDESPTTPLPPPQAHVSRATHKPAPSGPLNRAVTGLENLMEEAIGVARDAAKTGRHEEVATVLNEATLALRKASTVRGHMVHPRRPSLSGSDRSSDGDYHEHESDLSSRNSRDASAETFPTVFTKNSLQPLVAPSGKQTVALVQEPPKRRSKSSGDNSICPTPPRLYQTASADSIVRDFAYGKKRKSSRSYSAQRAAMIAYGAAAAYYHDHGQSVKYQPGIRKSIVSSTPIQSIAPGQYQRVHRAHKQHRRSTGDVDEVSDARLCSTARPLRRVKGVVPDSIGTTGPDPSIAQSVQPEATPDVRLRGLKRRRSTRRQSAAMLEPAYFPSSSDHTAMRSVSPGAAAEPRPGSPVNVLQDAVVPPIESHPPLLTTKNLSLRHPRRNHLSLKEEQGFSLGRYHKRQPIAREWNLHRKRLTAAIACLNTIFIGLIAGIYAGEVPGIQYQLADEKHWVIFGNMLFFAGLGLTTLVFWPLPLLHGRKPYTLLAFGIMLPLQIPQAMALTTARGQSPLYMIGLLLPRALTGLALGFANINFLPTLFDLYGASLMSERPHQEFVDGDDVRRQGGGIGVWLGIWTFCFSSSLSIGFCVGACIISGLDPSWGFWIIAILLAFFLLVNVLAPETRRAPYRRSIAHVFDKENPDQVKRRVARGEVKLHIYMDGPKWWWEEVGAGLVLTKRMVLQPGFFVLMSYLGWIKAQLTLVILLLGALLSRDYAWKSSYVGLAALSVPIGAILAMPLTKASWLSRDRVTPPRTDSMTFQKSFSWSSHLIRRAIFSLLLPLAGLAYCLTATGPPFNWTAVVIFAGLVGFLTDLGIAECVGLIMETFDTCDLQPGVNQRHRLQSLSDNVKRRRTNYSSFPRVCAGFFAAQSLGFFLAAGATVVSGRVTNSYGSQTAISIVAGILLAVTLLLLIVVWRWKQVQVIPEFSGSGVVPVVAQNGTQTRKESKAWDPNDPQWKAVVIGNPSGKMRRMNILELGSWSRWTEIRKLNKLVKE
ncbi:unnamed protein product [Zymoseptoria tritici ST99CH_1A5]|uniref:Uncharacterized protein n=1 Tax=Zymoseptoria tritici ST99CH_1A5 TaxID=1276529 RepID=A0A1Y6LGX9_ZYMTR|nr:unnamed protein product [Zymoseptoria tritici ST99CH_1A5]